MSPSSNALGVSWASGMIWSDIIVPIGFMKEAMEFSHCNRLYTESHYTFEGNEVGLNFIFTKL